MNYVLDTNVILFYLKDSSQKAFVEKEFTPFNPANTAIISIVTLAEIRVLGRRNSWGERRLQQVERLLNRLLIVDISTQDIVDAYVDIESYGENNHPIKRYKHSSRNMGKNDLWIAATALVTGSALITADQDFVHLDEELIKIHLVS